MAEISEDYSPYYTVDGSGNWTWNNTIKQDEYEEWQSDYARYTQSSSGGPVTGPVPRHSRYSALNTAVNQFLDILQQTESKELVSLTMFSSSAQLKTSPSSDYTAVRNVVNATLPTGSTYIASGLDVGKNALINNPAARPYSQKTIILFTDGVNTTGANTPIQVAQDIVDNYPIVIFTVTLSYEADQATMQSVADIGGGSHFHADNASELTDAFKTVAKNLPTILTD